jgi:hypothetical protein
MKRKILTIVAAAAGGVFMALAGMGFFYLVFTLVPAGWGP